MPLDTLCQMARSRCRMSTVRLHSSWTIVMDFKILAKVIGKWLFLYGVLIPQVCYQNCLSLVQELEMKHWPSELELWHHFHIPWEVSQLLMDGYLVHLVAINRSRCKTSAIRLIRLSKKEVDLIHESFLVDSYQMPINHSSLRLQRYHTSNTSSIYEQKLFMISDLCLKGGPFLLQFSQYTFLCDWMTGWWISRKHLPKRYGKSVAFV
jgi:hypothetical protein